MEKFILRDFTKLKEEGLIEYDFSNYEELLDVLSEMFKEEYDCSSDAQDAFDNLDSKLNGKLNEYAGVYTLGTKEWSIKIDVKEEDKIKNLIDQWNVCYGEVEDIDDLASSIEHRVCKDMSNVGCDVHNALAMLCSEVFEEYDSSSIYADIGEENPRIEFLL